MKRTQALIALGGMLFVLYTGCEQLAGPQLETPERAAAPTASPRAGKVGAGTRVALSTGTEGAAIYYTIDGTAPDATKTHYQGSILIDAALTIKAVAVKDGIEDSEPLEAAYTIDPNVTAAPAAEPPAGEAAPGTEISLSTATEGAEIYYTTDGSAPDSSKTKYAGAIVLDAPLTIRAVAVKEGLKDSAVLEAAYTIGEAAARAATPTAYPPAGGVDPGATVALSTATEGAEIYYTADGTEPDRTKTRYTEPLSIAGAVTIKALAVKAEWTDSAVLTAAYMIKAARPSASPAAGEVLDGTLISLSTATEGAEIYYTLDGTAPDRASAKYAGGIPINAALTIRAAAVQEGLADSDILTAAYTGKTAPPVASPGAGEVAAGAPISLSTSTEGAEIYYTLDGTEPDRTKARYEAPLSLTAAATIKAVAVKEGFADSGIFAAAYILSRPGAAARPSTSPAPGAVDSGAAVSLSTSTEGAEIYYTLDGTEPDRTKTRYAAPIVIATGTTIRARAVKQGLEDSDTMTAAYTVKDRAAAPVASPPPGAVDSGAAVSLSTATEEAEIYYTTDGTAPDKTKTKYAAPLSITTSTTIRAAAVKEGLTDSDILVAVYTVKAAPPTASLPGGAVEYGAAVSLSTPIAGVEIYYTLDGSAPDRTKTKYAAPLSITAATTIRAMAVKEGLEDSGVITVAYTVTAAAPEASPSAGAVIFGAAVSLSTTTPGAEIYYTMDGRVPDRTRTKYTAPISITAAADIRAVAVKEGLTDSGIITAAYTVTAAPPAASPPTGAVIAGTTVSLSTATIGAEIYYTLDGSAPDRTMTKYTAPISISAATTIKAIAVKEGLEDSGIVTAAYTIAAVAKPVADPPAGEVPFGMGVILSTATEGAEIYYTTDGTAPDSTKLRYAGAIVIDEPLTIRAIAAKPGMTDSAVLTASYTIAVEQQPEDSETPVVVRLEIASLPDITFYAKGQAFDPAGLRVNEVYSDGSVKELFSYTIDPVNTARAGQKMVYVRSGALSAYFTIYVDSSDVVLRDIVFKRGPTKTVYELGENFSKTGILFTAIYSDGSEQELGGEACSYAGYDQKKRGAQTVALKVNNYSYAVDVTVKVPANATVTLNDETVSDILDTHYRHVHIKNMPLDFAKLNLKATVTANGVTAILKGGVDFSLEEINLRGYNAAAPGLQTLSFDLDDKKGISFWVYVADVESGVWFDYGYKRTASDPRGVGPGAGKYYAQPGETLVLAPVRYLIGYNDDHTPGPVSYDWSVTGGSYTGVPSANGETYAFTPAAAGTYTVRVQVTGRDFVTGGSVTKSAETELVCYTETVDAGKTFVSPFRNYAPGQFVGNDDTSSRPWSLGAFGGYEVWAVDPQDSYQIRGNPFAGWSEPGVVWMQEDRNNNGIPDEMWHELIGEQEGPLVTRPYALTYIFVREGFYIHRFAWVDCKGRSGMINGNQSSTAPGTYTGTLLNDNGKIAGSTIGPGGWGYVDSWNSHADWDYFYPSNAVKADGSPANLGAVRFIKVHTGLFMYGDVFGENSTEIQFADNLPDQSGNFPDPVGYE
jgi:hypothetical protein